MSQNNASIVDSISTTNWTQFGIQTFLSLASIIFTAGIAWLTYQNTSQNAKIANQIQLDSDLYNCRRDFVEFLDSISKNPNDETLILKFNHTKEAMLNIYETMCKMYLENKIDKAIFKSLRKKEITNLFDAGKDAQKTFPTLHNNDKKYKSLKYVYDEFEKE